MTSAHHVDAGNLAIDESVAESWYGCSGCLRCRSHCTHRNEVAATLYAARAEAISQGDAPKAAQQVLEDHETRTRCVADAATRLFGESIERADARFGFMPGCTAIAVREKDGIAGQQATETLLGSRVRVMSQRCCGLPLLEAGDPESFRSAASAALAEISNMERTVFLDPGCLHALKVEAARHGLEPPAEKMLHLTELAAQHIDRIEPRPREKPPRYHDPCRLGRGLGVYEAPRRVLAKIVGQPVAEFHNNRHDSICSGAGGQLPRTSPSAAADIAKNRVAQHEWEGGGTIVTACPASATQLEKKGGARVVSFASLLAESCGGSD